MVASAKRNGDESRWIAGRDPAREANLDHVTALGMGAMQARRQGRGVVDDYRVTWSELRCEIAAGQVPDGAVRASDKQFARSPVGAVGGHHAGFPTTLG